MDDITNSDRLDWKPETQFRKERALLQVNSAIGRTGRKLYSWNLSCITKAGKATRHMGEVDIEAACDLVLELKTWRIAQKQQDRER